MKKNDEVKDKLLTACKRAFDFIDDELNNKIIVEMNGSFGLWSDLKDAIDFAEKIKMNNSCKCLEIIEARIDEIKRDVAKTNPDEAISEKDFHELQSLLKIYKSISESK